MNIIEKWVRGLTARFMPGKRHPRHLATGIWGEEQTETFLQKKGHKILGRRVRVGRRDELDIITRSPENILVFVEVKTRANVDYGRPGQSVDHHKQRKLSRAAWNYIKRLKSKPEYFRFDVVEVVGSPESASEPEIRHIENAFPLAGGKRIYW
ncbi:MAG TPA: YraN family protein [Kiritimatiellia bacterium]|nr:YraN family protein [Kiritimatiellia bacterium]